MLLLWKWTVRQRITEAAQLEKSILKKNCRQTRRSSRGVSGPRQKNGLKEPSERAAAEANGKRYGKSTPRLQRTDALYSEKGPEWVVPYTPVY
jgi:hypothetical protein